MPNLTPPRFLRLRLPASVVAVAVLFALSVTLLLWNRLEFVHDARLATGPPGSNQEAFFERALSRPDLLLFFRDLRPEERLAMAANLARYPKRESAALAARLIETFDEEARAELTRSLGKLAEIEPKWVTAELGSAASFQAEGVFEALQRAGDRAIPAVATALENPALRAGAQRFLAETGPKATPHVLPLLNHPDEGTRIGAATTLARIGARAAAAPIARLFSAAKGDARIAYMEALSLLGDPSSEPIFARIAMDPTSSERETELAASGLGKGATPQAMELLECMAGSRKPGVRSAAIQGLALAGDAGLRPGLDAEALALVARSVRSTRSDEALRRLVLGPKNERRGLLAAIDACRGRPGLANALREFSLAADPRSDGDLLDAATQALASTEPGRALLRRVGAQSALYGFAARALVISSDEPP